MILQECGEIARYLVFREDVHEEFGVRLCEKHLQPEMDGLFEEAPAAEFIVAALNYSAKLACDFQEVIVTTPPRKRDRKPWELWLRRNLRRVYMHHGYRGARFEFEWANYSDVRYLTLGMSLPDRHAWWATQITIYTSLGRGPNILGWIPSKVYRYYGKRTS